MEYRCGTIETEERRCTKQRNASNARRWYTKWRIHAIANRRQRGVVLRTVHPHVQDVR
jgi:hypothetical protein